MNGNQFMTSPGHGLCFWTLQSFVDRVVKGRFFPSSSSQPPKPEPPKPEQAKPEPAKDMEMFQALMEFMNRTKKP